MATLSTSGVPSLLGGVSQQPAEIRLPNQAEDQVNLYPSPVEGLIKRHPLEHIKRVTVSDETGKYFHTINRDSSERYVAMLGSETVNVFGTDGTEYQVKGPDGGTPDLSYLSVTDPTRLRALTVADYTIVVNPDSVVKPHSDHTLEDRSHGRAFLFVRQGAYLTDYVVKVKVAGQVLQTAEANTWDGTTSGAGPDSIKTNEIAEHLRAELDAFTNITATRQGSVVEITSDYVIEEFVVNDSAGNAHLIGFNREVERITDLPLTCRHGYKVKITNNEAAPEDDYWVQFQAKTQDFGEGRWVETVAPGIPHRLDETTMPHQLVRMQDDVYGSITGTGNEIYFEWSPISWTPRQVGDSVSNPFPSFVSPTNDSRRYVTDVFFFKGRLGFLSDQNVILSASGDFFNFFRGTVLDVLDSDPIDVSSNHVKVSLLHSAVPFQERLILFSDRTQFVLEGLPTLTPQTVSITPVLEYENFTGARPKATGDGVYFGYPRGSFSGVRQMFQVSSDLQYRALDLTASVPKYVTGEIIDIASTTLEDLVVLLADGDRSSVWVYKYFEENGERLQSAWSRYEFAGSSILSIDFIENTLYVMNQRADGLYLESMTFSAGVTDTDSPFQTRLDRRVTEADCTVVYDAPTKTSTITLPFNYTDAGNLRVVKRATPSSKAGPALQVASSGANSVVVRGDHTSSPFWAGEVFTSTYKPSRVIRRAPSTSGGLVPLLSEELTVLEGILSYTDTGYFKAKVTQKGSTDRTKEYTGGTLGTGTIVVDEVTLKDGAFKFEVTGDPRDVSIELINDSHLPSQWTTLEWILKQSSKVTRA